MTLSPPRIIAMIPARIGSTRLKYKNLRLLGGKPVIAHVIDSAVQSGVFDCVVVNSDSPVFAKIAARHGAEFYHRPEHLGSSETRSDEVITDFMDKHPGDILVWVNSIAPLQPVQEIKDVVGHFIDNELDSLITVKDEQVHCVFKGEPVNFIEDEPFARTQDLVPVQPFVYSLMMWRYTTFQDHYAKNGYALLSGKVGYHPVCRDSTIIIKREEDLMAAEISLQSRAGETCPPTYDPAINDL